MKIIAILCTCLFACTLRQYKVNVTLIGGDVKPIVDNGSQ